MLNLVARPATYRQFGPGHSTFCLVVEEQYADAFTVAPGAGYTHHAVLRAAGASLMELLAGALPDDADVLVIATRADLAATSAQGIGTGRTLAVLTAQANHNRLDDVGRLLTALEHSDPDQQEAAVDRIRTAVATGGPLRIEDELTGSAAVVDDPAALTLDAGHAGRFRPGVAHTAPGGWVTLSADGGPSAPLGMSGQLAVKGRPIVLANGRPLEDPHRQDVYERLLPITHYPLVLTLNEGTVADIKAVKGDGGAETAVRTLRGLFDECHSYRSISGLGFGVNSAIEVVRANAEANRARAGADEATAHIVLGAVPSTSLEVILPIDTSTMRDARGTVLAVGPDAHGAGATPRRRLNRVSSASCGCH